MNKKTIFLILIFAIKIYECKMKDEPVKFFEVIKDQYEKISNNMKYIGNGEITEKSLILDIKDAIYTIICPSGKCSFKNKDMISTFVETINEKLEVLQKLKIPLKSLSVDAALYFFLEISKKYLICNGNQNLTDTVNYIVNFYAIYKFTYPFSYAGAVLGSYICPFVCTVGFSYIGAYSGTLLYDYLMGGKMLDICKFSYLF